jgi:hypothetical protein
MLNGADMPRMNPQQVSMDMLLEGITSRVSISNDGVKFKRMYANDRIAFAHDVFPEYSSSITFYQDEILGAFDDGHRRVAVRGPHGLGKTFIAAVLVHHAVLTAEEDCKVPCTASAWRQLEKYLFPEIHKLASKVAWSIVQRAPYTQHTANSELLGQSIRLNGGLIEAFALASDNFTALEGAHAKLLFYVFDEAKTIPSGMWDAAEGAFATEGLEHGEECRALAVSTPGDPSGRFYDIHMHKPGYEDWWTRHVTLEEAIRAKRVSAEWARQRALQWGEASAMYQNRVCGEFADDTEEGIIPRSWVLAAIARYKEWDGRGRPELIGKRVLGVDTARSGEDSTVIAVRNASTLVDIHGFSKLPTTETALKVKMLSNGSTSGFAHAKSRAIGPYDLQIEMDGGLGASVYDILKDDNVPGLRPITVGAKTFLRDKSGEMKFANVRAAMWWKLREMLDPTSDVEMMLPDAPLLLGDLITPKWTITKDAVILIESKDAIRKRIGRSTDYGDACCLAFWNTSGGGGVVF